MSLELPFCNVNKTTDRNTTTSDMKVGQSYYCFKIKMKPEPVLSGILHDWI